MTDESRTCEVLRTISKLHHVMELLWAATKEGKVVGLSVGSNRLGFVLGPLLMWVVGVTKIHAC